MKKRIFIPLEIEFTVDEVVMGGKITDIKVHEKILTGKEIKKLFEPTPKPASQRGKPKVKGK